MTDRFHSLDFLRAFALLMGVPCVDVLFLEPFDGSEPRLVPLLSLFGYTRGACLCSCFWQVFYRS